MNFLKKITIMIFTIILGSSLFLGCAPKNPDDGIKPVPPPPADGRIPTPHSFLLDDFNYGAGGFTESEFYINNNVWGYNNNGVKGESVGFTKDGIAVLKAYGDFTDKPNFKRSGSCILSHEYVGPGMLEVAMKVMPRLGGCTAIWPFYAGTNQDTGAYQYQEIDIEIPAGAEGNKVAATFEKVMNTNYANTWNETTGGPVRSTKTETLTPANDGAWHKYGIKWETSPKPRVRYYVDDVLTSDTNDDPNGYKTVSSATAPIQIGVWFPDGWAGDRNFDSSAALIDWVSFEPYSDQPILESKKPSQPGGIYPQGKYPLKPIELPENNYISNGDFESGSNTDEQNNEKYPWSGDFSFASLVDNGVNKKAINLTAGKEISQIITGVYGKTRLNDRDFKDISYYYNFEFSGLAKATKECEATVKIEFLDISGRVIPSGTKKINVNATSNLALNVSSVNGSKAMKVTISVTKGNVVFDNLKMKLIEPKK